MSASDFGLGTSSQGSNSGTSDPQTVDPTVGILTVVGVPGAAEGGAVSAGAAPGDSASSLLGPAEDVVHVTIVEGCGCAFCLDVLDKSGDHDGLKVGEPAGDDPTGANPETGNVGQLLTIGQNPDGSYFFSGNRNVDATLIGVKWGLQDLTFSFPTAGSNYNGIGLDANGVNAYHIDLGTFQQAAARDGFAQIAAATGLTFTEIAETDTVHANIRISQTADQDVGSAYGGFPSDTRGVAGDSWFGRTSQPYYDLAIKGTWGYSTMLHEIGHTMGLKHGHQDYTNSDLSFFFGTTPRFGSQSLTPDRDGQAWSLMTYTPAPFTNSNFAGEKINQPQTFMQYDLAALQYMYGANYTTNATDSTYTFSQTTGEMFIDGVGQGAPSGNKIFLTIWDGGGNDTIDASNYANGVTIDLRPGEFSTVDQAQLANNLAFQNLTSLAPGNIAMSLLYNNDARSLIENATGGAGNDIFVGNIANNILDGGAGSDTVIFTGATGIAATLNDTGVDVIVAHDGETDTLRNIENIVGTAGDDTLTGNSQNNMLVGGLGGTDMLFGNGGDDQLIGGGFTVTNNAIITKSGSTANLSIATAVDPQSSNGYTLVSDANIASSTTIPHATINATAVGGGLEYYRVDATAGATATFDIDFSSIDTWIELVDSTGTVLANNDDNFTDVGSGSNNSLLSFTFATTGTYYIRVGRWTQPADTVAQPLAAGTTYTLHISLSSATVNAAPLSAVNTSSATLNGGEGNDFLQGTLGNDKIRGGTGNDTASYVTAFSNTATGVTVNLSLQTTAQATQDTVAAGVDSLSGIENLIGSQYNDTLTGDANANMIEGGAGNDALVGGAGDDTASYAGATAGVTVSLALQGSAQNTVGAGTDTLSGFQNLLGSAFNDSLTGDVLENVLTGGAGDDTLNPGANAPGTADLLDGGIGSDTASFAGYTAAVTATLNGEDDGTATVGGLQIAALRNIENLTGTDLNDVLTGDANANAIEGGLGDDMLDGGAGSNDTVRFSGSTAVTVNLATLTAQATGWGNDTIVNFENVRTGSGADNVTGDGNDNIFFEGGGADTYNGAAGVDTLDYSASTSTVTVNLNTLTAQNTGTFGGSDTITNIENVVGAATFNNTLTGNASANRFTGGSGVDTVQGNAGNDTIFGGAGNDILLGGTSGAFDDASADTIEAGAGSDYLSGGQGDDILRGGEGDDTMVGGVGNTARQFFTGVDAGNDTYDGGDGTDIAIMVYDGRLGGATTAGISFDIGSIEGSSTITFDGVVVGSLTSVERVTFRGTTVDDTVRGGGTLDNLTGFEGNDILDGWFGNDLISGGLGDDTLIGGAGLDTVTYVNSLAGVTVDLRLEGVAQNTGGEGTDTLSGFEYLVGSNFGDTLHGTDDFNLIIDSGIGAGATALSQTDSIFGYGGNDTIHVTRAAGGVATNINLDGGTGDDFIELRSGTLTGFTLATSFAGLSASTTGGSLTYAPLGATSADRNVDVVTVDGGDGNDRIVLTGVASASVNAGSGADIVSISMRGVTTVNNYQITLGTGADVIQFGVGSSSGTSADVAATARTNRVTDFAVGNSGDRFEISNFLNLGLTGYTANSNAFASGHLRLVQSGSDLLLQADRDGAGVTNSFVTIFAISNGYTGGFTTFNFDGFIGDLTLTGIGALDETIIGANGNDTLSGGDGNDILSGLDGNDYLDGGAGADAMSGGTGNDTYVVDDFGDTVSEAGGSGIDTVRSSISFVLAADFENLVLTGTARRATGNDLDNVITGNASNNNIDGGAGNDTISGGAGNDRLTGGSGADLFIFSAGTGLDGVMDFVSGTDRLDLAALFSSFSEVQAATTNDVNGNAIINLGGGNSVTLFGLAANQLQAGDVIVGAAPQAPLKNASDAQIGIGHDVGDLALGYAPDPLSVHGSLSSMLVFEYMG